jgi:hypothetical protein
LTSAAPELAAQLPFALSDAYITGHQDPARA